MKIYLFENGRVDAENLRGEEIRKHEETYGKLQKVVIGSQIIPVDYRDNQIPVTEHAWYKRREGL